MAIWRANGGFCEVVVNATYLEELPYEIHALDEADYARLIQAADTGETKMKTTLTVEIEYDPATTDPEGLACAMDRLLETALSTPDILTNTATRPSANSSSPRKRLRPHRRSS